MFITILLAYLPYTLVTAFTPGPNNIIALYEVSQNGWRKGKGTLIGIGVGFLLVMILCALFCYELNQYIPSISEVLKYIGAAYILWLAVHIVRSKPGTGQDQKISFWKGLFLQLINVKIVLFSITTFSGFVLPVTDDLMQMLGHAVCFTIVGMSGILTWAAAGGLLQNFLSKHYKPFNLLMATMLIFCAVKIVLG